MVGDNGENEQDCE